MDHISSSDIFFKLLVNVRCVFTGIKVFKIEQLTTEYHSLIIQDSVLYF